MIKYRPHRGSLEDAMREALEFADIADMLKHIEEQWDGAIETKDIVISESHGKDERIGWESSRYICAKKCGDEVYDIPQCIGFCDLGEL